MTALSPLKVATRCAGCGVPFVQYGITAEEGAQCDGKVYCNWDCHGEAEVRDAERAEYDALSEDY